MSSMSCLDPLEFLFVSQTKQVNPVYTAWQHLACPAKRQLGLGALDLNRVFQHLAEKYHCCQDLLYDCVIAVKIK